jgi:hypothetical protein
MFRDSSGNAVTWHVRRCNKTELTCTVRISCVQYLLKSSLLDHYILSTLSIWSMEHMMDQKVNVKFCVKLQKSLTGKMPVCGVAITEFAQAKRSHRCQSPRWKQCCWCTFVISRVWSTLNLYPKGLLLIWHSVWRYSKGLLMPLDTTKERCGEVGYRYFTMITHWHIFHSECISF